ncbi:MAG: GNAT family N-acetyltransferase [Ignavibacteriae bacterium]|nr:GNAT family N-acetyltransferase [Ignavibacteriota bacterium]
MEIISREIKEQPEKFDEVLALHKANTKTLGFLPRQAFKEAVTKNEIIIAVDSNNNLAGYLLYYINKRGNFISITQFCVSSSFRKKGIAKLLFKRIIDKYNTKCRGVRVTCRADFSATKIWEKLGFTWEYEKPGRSKSGSTLFVWWFDFNHPDLFSIVDDNNKLKVVLDSNIVYDLMKPKNIKTQNSYALLSDWLNEDVDYYITDQLKNDISHNKNTKVRKMSKEFISQFKQLSSDHNKYYIINDEVKTIYNKSLNSREESDIRHITRTINSDATYFLTKDGGIIDYSKEFFDRYSLLVLKPEEFIMQFSSLINNIDYQPSRLAGTTIQKKSPTIEELREIPTVFFQHTVEKKREFENKVNFSLADKRNTAILIKKENEKIVFYTTKESKDKLEIQFFRYIRNLKNRTIINQIIHDIIYLAREKQKNEIIISETSITIELEAILKHHSFIKIGENYYKFIKDKIISFGNVLNYLQDNIKNNPLFLQYKTILSSYLSDKKNAFQIEKFLFPLKIIDSNIPCFIVPIRPYWAMNLFNVKLAEQDLFGGDDKLLFNRENVYYRSGNKPTLRNNSRILWYISKGNKNFTETMNITASSYINDVEIDKPKILYKKHQHLGVYKWENIFETAKYNLDNNIMAFSFDLTENFNNSISRATLLQIYNKYLHRDFFSPQTPYKISENIYFEIYKKGMKGFSNEK